MPEQSSNCLFPVANVTDILNCTPDRTEGETAVRRHAQHRRGLGEPRGAAASVPKVL